MSRRWSWKRLRPDCSRRADTAKAGRGVMLTLQVPACVCAGPEHWSCIACSQWHYCGGATLHSFAAQGLSNVLLDFFLLVLLVILLRLQLLVSRTTVTPLQPHRPCSVRSWLHLLWRVASSKNIDISSESNLTHITYITSPAHSLTNTHTHTHTLTTKCNKHTKSTLCTNYTNVDSIYINGKLMHISMTVRQPSHNVYITTKEKQANKVQTHQLSN